MMTTGVLHVLASGVLLLAVMTTTFVQRAWAYSSELTPTPVTGYTTDGAGATAAPFVTDATGATEPPATSEDDLVCSDELSACLADSTCSSCLLDTSTTSSTQECLEYYTDTTTSEGCQFRLDVQCCMNDVSEVDCLANNAYAASVRCRLDAYYGCVVEEITCDGDESTSEFAGATARNGGASSGIAFSCAFIVLLSFLRV